MNHKEIPEKPILMSGPMVKAILANLKTQTRRTTGLKKINEDPDRYLFHKIEDGLAIFWDNEKGERLSIKLPYGLPGNNLWVREAWRVGAWWGEKQSIAIDYRADGYDRREWLYVPNEEMFERFRLQTIFDAQKAGITPNHEDVYDWEPGKGPSRWRPSIHIPRFASRINLEIIKVRVERLQDISPADCYKEGLKICPDICGLDCNGCDSDDPRQWFKNLWESISGPRSWAANPWLFVVEFKRVKP